jgi:ParB-like nuclease domain
VSNPADKVEQRSIASLIPYARNARIHSSEQIAQIAESIKEWGWTIPVLVDESGQIIAGHGRVAAAQLLDIKKVPVMVAKGWTDAQKQAYVLADNKLAMNAGWDDELLTLELQDLKELGSDLSLIGFSDDELVKLFEEDNYSNKNTEINVDDFDGLMELKFKLTFQEFEEAKERLLEISNTPEVALKILLKMSV